MSWTAVVRDADGILLSIGDVTDPQPPASVVYVALAGPPNLRTQTWDPATRAFIARPAKVLIDRLQDLVADAALVAAWATMNATQRQAVRQAVINLLGTSRYRNAGEGTTLDG
jgi:hypothetical protein